MTRLDDAHAAMMQNEDDDAARLRFYSQLADTELFVLLSDDPPDDQVHPRIFDLDEGQVVLAFDLEERLAGFVGGPAPYAALPGRVIAAQLAGRGIGMGVNIGDAPSSILLQSEVLDWLTTTLAAKPVQTTAVPQGFSFPWNVPAEVTQRLQEKLGANPDLAEAVLLAEVMYEGGRRGHVLAILGAAVGAEAALSGTVSEALVFSGVELGEIDVVFLGAEDPRIKTIADVALRLDLPRRMAAEIPAPTVPGMNPEKPPILR